MNVILEVLGYKKLFLVTASFFQIFVVIKKPIKCPKKYVTEWSYFLLIDLFIFLMEMLSIKWPNLQQKDANNCELLLKFLSDVHSAPLASQLYLRNTNQLSDPYSSSLRCFFLPFLSVSHFLACPLLLTGNKCCITILILPWVCKLSLLLEMYGEPRVRWMLTSSTTRKWYGGGLGRIHL